MVEVSKSMSMKGYSLKTWLIKTKGSFKILVMAIIAVSTFFIPTIETVGLSAAIAGLSTALSKWLMDLLDFWLTDVVV